jgi:hypothetical protein
MAARGLLLGAAAGMLAVAGASSSSFSSSVSSAVVTFLSSTPYYSASDQLTKVLVDGSKCLDGSSAGYYYRASNDATSKLWVVFLEGGGACFDEDSCAQRAKTDLGSSKGWADAAGPINYVLSSDPALNQYFHTANMVRGGVPRWTCSASPSIAATGLRVSAFMIDHGCLIRNAGLCALLHRRRARGHQSQCEQ